MRAVVWVRVLVLVFGDFGLVGELRGLDQLFEEVQLLALRALPLDLDEFHVVLAPVQRDLLVD